MTTSASLWRGRMERARWFAGKGLPGRLVGLHPLKWATRPGFLPAVRSELAVVEYPTRRELYHLLSGYLPAGTAEPEALLGQVELEGAGLVDLVDAPASATAARAWLDALAAGYPGVVPVGEGADLGSAPELFSGEQSNTTIVVGDVLVKVFRRLEPGRNLDVEVLNALNDLPVTPRLDGWVHGAGELPPDLGAAADYDLAMICQRLPQVRDGWRLACSAAADGLDFCPEAFALGKALDRLHGSLATAFGRSSLASDHLAGDLRQRAEWAAAEAPVLKDLVPRLSPTLALLPEGAVPTQRIHGDFHLGQTLLGPDGWHIIDFEGEPLKSLAQRRRPDSVWRDVAGLLRSLDYARSAAGEPASDAARQWSRTARSAFLAGYGEPGPEGSRLLSAYQLDKALYEVVYEVRNRPDWAAIPLAAVQDEVERLDAPPSADEEESWPTTRVVD